MTDLRSQLQSTFGEAYTIERELGGGGMSRVFVATERSLGRPVVVKVLPSETAGAVSVERFRREIRLAASLQQANIVPVLSAGDAGGVAYYTMPFVRGESLRAHLAATGALPIAECLTILRDVARALAFAHAEGVVHRDIKPENILLSGGTAVVTDFGIAKAVAASSTQPGAVTLTQMGLALGTPAYMAPEQALGEQVDHRADIYALGVVAYEMLTGTTPFAGRSGQAMLAAHLTESPPLLTEKRPAAPAGLVSLVARCLAKEQSDRPESATALLAALDTITTPEAIATAAPNVKHTKPTIAVLPLGNLSASADDEYFSDGVTEDIIAQLSRIPELQVIARTSVMRYKKTEKRAREIGTDLGASHIIEGTLRRAAQKLRIIAKLVDAHTEATLWTETFDRELQDVFAIQTEVAEHVADALRSTLELATSARLRTRRVRTNLDAYDAYLRGRFEWNKGTPDAYRRSIEHYERAIAIDPTFAEAHVALAVGLATVVVVAADPREGVERARIHAMRAQQLDPMSAEAHATLAYISFWFDWNWSEAERLFARAMELGPNSATTQDHLANFYANSGRPNEAIAAARRSIELDPLWSGAHLGMSWSLFQAGKFGESIASSNRALELAPDYALTLIVKGFSLIELGEFADAIAIYEHCLKASPDAFAAQAGLMVAHARAGAGTTARRLLAQLHQSSETSMPPCVFAWAHAALGELDAALDAVERMIDVRDPLTDSLAVFAWWDPLRGDPRFEEIMLRLRFPDSSRAVSEARRLAYAGRRSSSTAIPRR